MSQQSWSDDEIEYLIENYPDTPASVLSDELNRSEDSIYSKASRLDIDTQEKVFPDRDNVGDELIVCSSCGDEYRYTRSGGTTDLCRSCYESSRRKERKEKLIDEVFDGECESCGYDNCISALTFHHRNPEEKEFQLSSDGLLKSWDNIISEAEKCSLLCANCHSEHHCNSCDRKI